MFLGVFNLAQKLITRSNECLHLKIIKKISKIVRAIIFEEKLAIYSHRVHLHFIGIRKRTYK